MNPPCCSQLCVHPSLPLDKPRKGRTSSSGQCSSWSVDGRGLRPQTTSCSSQGEWDFMTWHRRAGAAWAQEACFVLTGPSALSNGLAQSSRAIRLSSLPGETEGRGTHLAERSRGPRAWPGEPESRGRFQACLRWSPQPPCQWGSWVPAPRPPSQPPSVGRVCLVELGFCCARLLHVTVSVAVSLRMQGGTSFGYLFLYIF